MDDKHSKHDKDGKDNENGGDYGYGYPVPAADDKTTHDPQDPYSSDPYGSSDPAGYPAVDNDPAACKSKTKFGKRGGDSKAMCCQLDIMGLVDLPCQEGIQPGRPPFPLFSGFGEVIC